MHSRPASICVPEPRLPWRLQPGLSDTRSISRSKTHCPSGGPDATELWSDAAASRTLARAEANQGGNKADHPPSIQRTGSGVPRHLARRVHELYFNPQHVESEPRTLWSLSNAFTSAFKKLDSIPRFKATAKLGEFLESRVLIVVPASGICCRFDQTWSYAEWSKALSETRNRS